MSYRFKLGQKVKFLVRSYQRQPHTDVEGGDDYYAKTRIQGSGTIIELYVVPASAGEKDKSFTRLKVEIRRGFTIDLDVKDVADKSTYIQPLD